MFCGLGTLGTRAFGQIKVFSMRRSDEDLRCKVQAKLVHTSEACGLEAAPSRSPGVVNWLFCTPKSRMMRVWMIPTGEQGRERHDSTGLGFRFLESKKRIAPESQRTMSFNKTCELARPTLDRSNDVKCPKAYPFKTLIARKHSPLHRSCN